MNYSFSIDFGIKILNLGKINFSGLHDDNHEYVIFQLNNMDFDNISRGSANCLLYHNNRFTINLTGEIALSRTYKITLLDKIDKITLAGSINTSLAMDISKDQSKLSYEATWMLNNSNPEISVKNSLNRKVSSFKDIANLIIDDVLAKLQHYNINDLLNLFDRDWINFVHPLGKILNDLGITPEKAAELLNGLQKFAGKPQEVVNILMVPGGFNEGQVKVALERTGISVQGLKFLSEGELTNIGNGLPGDLNSIANRLPH
ncbi:hypothetical protein V3851_10455 [Paenibacillus sp. M1]|uniref:Uncharacterized protein n=1 Tax=Paenibacillus haidiansis TaxID=1574488 RepID=A0ABU7VRB1_9BACL